MDHTMLYTLPQWFIFSGIFVIVYGWVESKRVFRIIGLGILLALGVYSIFTLMGDAFAASEFLTPEEVARQEIDGEISTAVPFEAKILPAYWAFVFATLLVVPGIVLDLVRSAKYKIFVVLSCLTELLGFFWIVGALRSL